MLDYFVVAPVSIEINTSTSTRVEPYEDRWGTTLRLHEVDVAVTLLDPEDQRIVVCESVEAVYEACAFLRTSRTAFQSHRITTSFEVNATTGELRLSQAT